MGYVFPVLRSIDEGIEHWIDADRWTKVAGLRLEKVHYFTFLPDFLPRSLMRIALPLERWLERGPARTFSVHYMAVMKKVVGESPVTSAPRTRITASTG
jgi:hypothetical protein